MYSIIVQDTVEENTSIHIEKEISSGTKNNLTPDEEYFYYLFLRRRVDMAIREVLQFGNPVLRAACIPIGAEGPGPHILTDLQDTLTHLQRIKGLGRGLAAPQIGYQTKAIYIHAPMWEGFLLNPEIVNRSGETFEVIDGCFSADLAFFGPVLRHRWVEVRYCDSRMAPCQERFNDDMSELIQHEMDHLDGILFIDRLSDPSRIVTFLEWQRRYRVPGDP